MVVLRGTREMDGWMRLWNIDLSSLYQTTAALRCSLMASIKRIEGDVPYIWWRVDKV